MFWHNGAGLKFVTQVDYSYSHDWMSFALWYSLQKFLPDASLVICCNGFHRGSMQLFTWPRRCRVSFGYIPEQGMLLAPGVVAVRELQEDGYESLLRGKLPICPCQDYQFLPFVSYENNCAGFVMSEWIHRVECPFSIADRFMTLSANGNEIQVLRLWKQMSSVYASVSR